MQQDSAKLARDLKEHMDRHGQSQTYIAELAGVNQGTVSRFLKKPPRKATEAHKRLCSYALKILSEGQTVKESVQLSFDECWKRSEAHQAVLSKIINAFAEFCRRDSNEEESSG